jgi:alpha-amylase/alpha-mannosidase (GH57 family)
MPDASRLKVVLCWHMHQPEYRDLITGESLLPWTYLHAIKDYADMAAHLESAPGAAAVVNFSPVLLLQLEYYERQVSEYLAHGTAIRDALLATLTPGGISQDPARRADLMRACLKVNRERIIERFTPFHQLAQLATGFLAPGAVHYAAREFLVDLTIWYHLGWLGESVRRTDVRVAALMAKERHFDAADGRTLLEVIGELLARLVPRYRNLAASGRVELSVTPYGHPILPLLLDLHAARDAQPDCALPAEQAYPGGETRGRWHLGAAVEVFERVFGLRPVGCWPGEGGVSDRALALIEEFGFRWAATGEAVLRNSLTRHELWNGEQQVLSLHRPYRLAGRELSVFFRHDALSDLIGFSYAKWHGDDAAANLTVHLEELADLFQGQPERVVAVVLDGENAWEYYPFNGYFFLSALYERLAASNRIELTTFARCIGRERPAELPSIVAGSWVYGTFSTWIGEHDKNRAWEMLCDAKRAFDQVSVAGSLRAEELRAAERQLAVCEGSDWCWWFGEGNPAEQVATFDVLYRRHLTNLYRLLQQAPPAYLAESFAHGGGSPELGGVMRRAQ